MRLLAVLLLLLPLGLRAQDQFDSHVLLPPVARQLDSVLARLQQPGLPDTTRLKLLVLCCRLYASTQGDSAVWYGQQALALARQRHVAWGEAKALLALAEAHYNNSDYLAAQRTVELALQRARASRSPLLVGQAYLGLGNVASSLGDTAAVETYYAQAQRCFASSQPRNVVAELSVLVNRATNYLNNDESPAQALPLLRAGLGLAKRYPGKASAAKLRLLLGMVQHMQQHPDSAAANWGQAVRLSQAEHNVLVENEAWVQLGMLALQRRAYLEALANGQRASRLARLIGDPELLDGSLNVQANALVALRRPEAYDSLRAFLEFRNIVYQRHRQETVANAQARFNAREKEARIRALEQQRRIAELETTQRRFRNRVQLAGLGGATLLLLGLGLAAYRRRQAAREAALRTRIAADLHDDVGSLLTQISLETELLRDGLYTSAEQPQQLHRLAEASRTAVRHMNDVVWGLDTRHDSMPDLLDRLRDHAHEVLPPKGLDIDFAVAPEVEASALPLPARQTLYLIYKEALHNVVKHATGATLVRVGLRLEASHLVLTVADDGQPTAAPGHNSPGNGHGLANMARRAATAGGQLHSGPAAGGGFAIEARLPLG